MKKDKIIEFIASQDWSVSYYENFNKAHEDSTVEELLGRCKPSELISKSFIWGNTPQGYGYWEKVEEEYQQFLEDTPIERARFDAAALAASVLFVAFWAGIIWAVVQCAVYFPITTTVVALLVAIGRAYSFLVDRKHS